MTNFVFENKGFQGQSMAYMQHKIIAEAIQLAGHYQDCKTTASRIVAMRDDSTTVWLV